jgi:hypothetical protein
VKGFKVGSSVQVGRCHRHEVDVLGHDFRKRVSIVFGPGIAECLREFAYRFLIGFGLRLGCGRRWKKEKKTKRRLRNISCWLRCK